MSGTLTDVRTEVRRLQDERKELNRELSRLDEGRKAKREELLKLPVEKRSDTSTPEFEALEKAIAEHGDVADKITDIDRAEKMFLRELADAGDLSAKDVDDDVDNDGTRVVKDWMTKDLAQKLAGMAGSRGKFGQVDFGEVVSKQELAGMLADVAKADLSGTTNMRRAPFGGIVGMARRRLSLLDLISTGTMSNNSFPYVQEGGTYAAAETTEGAAKPEAGITLTDATADAATIAHWKKILKQSLEDSEAIRTVVESHLRYGVLRRLEGQILTGNGTPPNLRGIRNTVGIQTQAFAAGPIATMLLSAIAKVFIAEGEANGIVLNPTDWASALTERDGSGGAGTGGYLLGGNAAATQGDGFDTPTVWGVPLLPNASQTAGFATVGDWAQGATLLIRSGVQVLMSDSDQDDFIKNRVTLLGEMRAALAVWRPAMFVDTDIVTP